LIVFTLFILSYIICLLRSDSFPIKETFDLIAQTSYNRLRVNVTHVIVIAYLNL